MKILIALAILGSAAAGLSQDAPNVYLTSKSSGSNWAAFRDQSQEMAKNFSRVCPELQLTTNSQDADYRVSLNHIEAGLFLRDNQVAVADAFGTLLSTMEKGSIKEGVRGACELILRDWSNPRNIRERLVKGINAGFQHGEVLGYSEISGEKLTVHSERASAMRFRMLLASRELSMVRRAGIAMYVYTNDADQTFVYDVKAGQILSAATGAEVRSENPPKSQ